MVWCAFTKYQVRDLHQAKGKISQTNYDSDHAIPSGTRLEGQGFVIIHDNDPKNTSKL